ncbi:capsular biosynthesis protein [Reichenbachiella agarivorans]|uniref:protein-tyrosine-phosphatase n=1 Tax=Reichenbachiella agarivorans TaxID=2979464 RepID=A0ABY6CSZ5_9BACT|nr:CpsB/CapC family capsule biosynthesis tyrosine phosphatase [Reichenbachiella agarivorans]UXP33642.1 capsular biosynthesis protein [Reichenbachiella agarivorans]
MFGLFKKKPFISPLTVDVHSHLISGIDDGVKTWHESIEIIKQLSAIGIKKVITTPHIIADYYPNTPEIIRNGVKQLNEKLKEQNILIEVVAGAEYYVDETFIQQINDNNELLSFSDGYILVETAFMNKPLQLEEVFFKLIAKGLKPIFAHPERYDYVQRDPDSLQKYIDMGVKLQINAASLTGHYSLGAKKTAEYIINKQWVHLIGSDIHRMQHVELYIKATQLKSFQKAGQLSLLNNSL